MPRFSDQFPDSAFSVREALRGGIRASTLRSRRFDRPFHGVRRLPERVDVEGPDEYVRICSDYAPRLLPGQFFSHTTALALWGAPVPFGPHGEVHVAVWHPASAPHTPGVIAHRLRPRLLAHDVVRQLPVERFERAWVQTCGLWRPDDLIAAADFAVHPNRSLVTLEQLRDELLDRRKGKFLPLLDDVREGAESSRETTLRLCLMRAGLPEPALNVNLFDARGTHVARLDLAYKKWKVAVEYDGRQHAFDVDQFRRDARRWDDIRAAGWTLVRVLNDDLADGGRAAVERTRRALREAGWDGLQPRNR